MSSPLKHWKMTRYASLPLIPLFFYFIAQVENITASDRATFADWAKQPVPSTALFIFVACAYYHAALGAEEIIEDYISCAKTKTAVRLANKLFFLILGAVSIIALFSIRFGAE